MGSTASPQVVTLAYYDALVWLGWLAPSHPAREGDRREGRERLAAEGQHREGASHLDQLLQSREKLHPHKDNKRRKASLVRTVKLGAWPDHNTVTAILYHAYLSLSLYSYLAALRPEL